MTKVFKKTQNWSQHLGRSGRAKWQHWSRNKVSIDALKLFLFLYRNNYTMRQQPFQCCEETQPSLKHQRDTWVCKASEFQLVTSWYHTVDPFNCNVQTAEETDKPNHPSQGTARVGAPLYWGSDSGLCFQVLLLRAWSLWLKGIHFWPSKKALAATVIFYYDPSNNGQNKRSPRKISCSISFQHLSHRILFIWDCHNAQSRELPNGIYQGIHQEAQGSE